MPYLAWVRRGRAWSAVAEAPTAAEAYHQLLSYLAGRSPKPPALAVPG
jgi:hypothetical protein